MRGTASSGWRRIIPHDLINAGTTGPLRALSSSLGPEIPAIPEAVRAHGRTWGDEYAWLQRGGPAVAQVLAQEAAHMQAWMRRRGADALASTLHQEVLRMLPEHVTSPPEQLGAHSYFVAQGAAAPHPHYLRRPIGGTDRGGRLQTVLDLNELAKVHGDDLHLGQMKLSKCGRQVAFTLAAAGEDECYFTFVRDLPSGRIVEQPGLRGVTSVEWAADGSTMLFTVPDSLGRPWQVLSAAAVDPSNRWERGKQAGEVVLEEEDPRFFVELQRSKDWAAVMVNVHSKTSSEVHWLPADDPRAAALRCIQPRRSGLEYFVEHHSGQLYILGNAGGSIEYGLFTAPAAGPCSESDWETLIAPARGVALEDLDVFESALVLHLREWGVPRVRVIPMRPAEPGASAQPDMGRAHTVPLPDWALAVSSGANADFFSNRVRLELSSPVQPDVAVDWVLPSQQLLTVQEPPRLAHHRPADYVCERQWAAALPAQGNAGSAPAAAAASPGAAPRLGPPITVVHRQGLVLDGSHPCLVVVYAAYGHCLPVDFVAERVLLLARGWVVALVHARGGGELGRGWHAAGRGANTATRAADVEAAMQHLQRSGYSKEGLFALEAQSAGGVAAAAALNRRPHAFGAAILEAPFVDVLSSMVDPTLALTQHEYDEWGDPSIDPGFDQLRRSCPYQGVTPGRPLPPIMLTCSQSDRRVPFWGPLKYAARVRAAGSAGGGGGTVLVAADEHEGHFVGERERYEFKAMQYAFLITAMHRT